MTFSTSGPTMMTNEETSVIWIVGQISGTGTLRLILEVGHLGKDMTTGLRSKTSMRIGQEVATTIDHKETMAGGIGLGINSKNGALAIHEPRSAEGQ